ncbi:PepSY domain-containing protein [Salipaludibacillus sp. CF4.18]|uniref:PepSY domain-containing protein n=1 Tax=Salipaludibacillus sp. CF4.18 TaxID=3373081 RepID=UPI003EE54271
MMKKLTIILTTIFALGGTTALGMATTNSNVEQAELQSNTAVVDTVGAEEDKITEEEAVKIAQNTIDGKLDEVELDTDDGVQVYEVEIDFEGDDYDIKVDAYTGEIRETDDDLLNTPVADEVSISLEEAKKIVSELAPGGIIDDVDLEMKNSRYVYEIEVEINDEDGDVQIDAETGEILKLEDDLEKLLEGNSSSNEQINSSESKGNASKENKGEQISSEEAKEIALAHVGNGKVDDIELDNEDGLLLFEVEVEHNDDDVEVYIDAYTGEVVYVD